jgi:hypothetical protein
MLAGAGGSCICTRHLTSPALQIVGDDGEELVAEDVVKQNGGISGGAYGGRVTFSAGVQFGITDPAASARVGLTVLPDICLVPALPVGLAW